MLDWITAIASLVAAVASVVGVILSLGQTGRRKPIVTCKPHAFAAHPGWHQIEVTVRNYADAPLRVEAIEIEAPRWARLVPRTAAESPDGFGHPQPNPDLMLRSNEVTAVPIGFEIGAVTGGGNAPSLSTYVYAHCPSSERPTFRLRCCFSWSDRPMRRFAITITTKQPA